jgi:hypothetical protein
VDHEVIRAIGRLESRGVLGPGQAAFFGRVARRGLVSVRLELRTLLSAGVLLILAGTGLLVREHFDRIGPTAVAAAILAAAALCLAWVNRRSPPFSRGEVPSPGLAFDSILALGVLLFGSFLAWVETQFHTLGAGWRHHLLLLAVLALAAAFRFDSRSVFSLALTSFAAWRGVDARLTLRTVFGNPEEAIRWNSILCGALFLLGAWVLTRARWKAHFEPVSSNLGLLLLLGALLSGVLGTRAPEWPAWEAALLAVGAAVIAAGWRERRTLWFSQGVVAVYAGALRVLFEASHGAGAMFLVAVTSLGLVALLVVAHRRLREAE